MALWLLFINIAAFITFGIDKWKAEQHMWRIPEATLLGLAAAGGSIGALAGMPCTPGPRTGGSGI